MKDEHTMQTPEEHRLEAELRVCDPEKVGRSYEVEHTRVLRMSEELHDGFETLKKYKLAATIFGSARCGVGDDIYTAATALARALSEAGFAIVTGGGGGIMEAANKGAFEAGGDSVGLNIVLPQEQHLNEYVTESKAFRYFFTRKVMLAFASEVYIYFPGGFGTFDELFEILTLIQTGKIKRVPVILYGKAYWQPILELLEKHLYGTFKTISKEDMELYMLVDSVEEARDTVLRQVHC